MQLNVSHCFKIDIQISRADFETYFQDSEIFKALDKNHDGHVTLTEATSKAELAFQVKFNT